MNTEIANPTPEPQPITAVETPAAEPKTPSPEEMYQRAAAYRIQQFENAGQAERVKILKSRGLITAEGKPTEKLLAMNPAGVVVADAKPKYSADVILTPEQARELAPLEGDSIRYAKDAGGSLRIALDRHGLLAMPKGHGRKHPRMSAHKQAIKSVAIGIFGRMFTTHATKLQAAAEEKGEQFVGVPNADLPAIGARATVLAAQRVKKAMKALHRRARNEKKLARRINAGVLPGNTNRRAYTA